MTRTHISMFYEIKPPVLLRPCCDCQYHFITNIIYSSTHIFTFLTSLTKEIKPSKGNSLCYITTILAWLFICFIIQYAQFHNRAWFFSSFKFWLTEVSSNFLFRTNWNVGEAAKVWESITEPKRGIKNPSRHLLFLRRCLKTRESLRAWMLGDKNQLGCVATCTIPTCSRIVPAMTAGAFGAFNRITRSVQTLQ